MGIVLGQHQIKAIDELHNGCILLGDVGTGKSRTAIAYYYTKVCKGSMCINGVGSYEERKEPKHLYIITTALKRDRFEWEIEASPFLLTEDDITVDSWQNVTKYKDVKDAFFIFDEQRVVGYGAWAKAFIQISKSNEWILLTATPGDKWMDYLPVFIANGFYKNKTDFVNQHVVYNRYTKYPKPNYIGTARLNKYRHSILVKMRFDKHTIPHHENVKCSYDKAKMFKIIKDRWNVFEESPIKNISEFCYCMRRCTNEDPSRLEAIKDLIAVHPKVIIFYNFNFELDLLKALGKELDINVAEWNGHTHQPIPKAGRWMYLVQYTSGAEGWNCIETDTIIFYSQNYSYKTLIQAAGRIDRLNTPFTDLYYYYLKSDAQIDIGISKALKQKEKFNESMFVNSTKEVSNDYNEV